MNTLSTKTIREIALEAPATTRVFEEFKIDYCCGGRRSIADACSAEGIDSSLLIGRIKEVIEENKAHAEERQPEQMDVTSLVTYILDTHHVFTKRELDRLVPLMAKVAMRHGSSHSELFELQNIFQALVESLRPHMRKEEEVLFPYMLELDAAKRRGDTPPVPMFGTVRNPIRMMMMEHDTDGDRLRQMRSLAKDYILPEGACPSFTALYAGLQDLERDLHRHIHLENNVLFPAAAELESN